MDRKLSTDSILVFILGFTLSILFSSFVSISYLLGWLFLIVATAVVISEKIWRKHISKEVLFISIFLFSVGSGIIRYSIKDFHEPIIPSPIGVVVSEPEQRENTTRFVLKTENGEKVLVNTDLYSHVQYGDKVEVSGKFEKPRVIEDGNNGRLFDYGKYLAKDDIYNILNFAEVKIISGGNGNPIKQVLFKVKRVFVSKIKDVFSEPYSSLLSGLVVSGREAMPKDIIEEFRRAGIVHIVVLSGYNITIIAEFIRRLFQNIFIFARVQAVSQLASGVSILAIISFVLMTGAEATVVRAALMVLTIIVAKMFGRNYSAPRALLIAAFLMLVENPKILVFDPSFQLSFLATLALIYVLPIIEKYLSILPEKFGIRTITATTLATQITVLPLLIYSMGEVSLIALPVNLLVLFVIPLTMLLGFLATVVAFVSTILALPLSYATHLLLAWILWVSSTLGNLTFSSISVPPVSFWIIILLYLAIFIFVWRKRNYLQHSAN